jgi:putative endonuclease
MSYYLYILKSKTADRYYVGSSANPYTRLGYHNTIEKGFTSRYRPWEIVFTKEYSSKEEAVFAEKKIKSWKRKDIIIKVITSEITI